MTDLPSVTVIIPVYNGAAHIRRALDSVARQTVPPLEVIVIDDGSTDDSASAISEAAAAAPGVDVRVMSQPNAGQSHARNRAAREARGDLLAFLDQDDLWHPAHIAVLAEAFVDAPGLGFCYGDFDEIDGDGHVVARRYIRAHGVEHPRSTVVEWIESDTMVIPTATVVRRSAYLEVGGFDPELIGYEDDDLWIRLFRAGWDGRFVEESVAMFRVHAESSSRRSTFRESRVRFFRKTAEALPDDPGLARYYASDILLPRMVRSALGEYLAALRRGADDEARQVASTIDELFRGRRSRILRRRERWALHHPALVRRGLRIRRMFRTSPGERLSPARRLREGYHEWTD